MLPPLAEAKAFLNSSSSSSLMLVDTLALAGGFLAAAAAKDFCHAVRTGKGAGCAK